MTGLLRGLAPISASGWAEIEEQATRTLKSTLAARKLVDFVGPLGWDASAIGLGRSERLGSSPQPNVEGRLRKAQPLVELHVPFDLSREELDAIDRGARDPDLDAVREAACAAAMAEDRAIFHGWPEAGIGGVIEAGAARRCTVTEDYVAYLGVVAEAVHKLRLAGVGGPYGIALGPRCHTGLTKTTIGGYPVIQHVRRLIDGPIVSAPAVDGAVVLSLRGGDFELTVGHDFAVGYLGHTDTTVRLYLRESFTFRVLSPEASAPLAYAD